MLTHKPKHILVAPLDWGLGHTTRCIPIIRHILRQGHVPVFAGNASQRSFIEETFGSIDNIHLDGYDIAYSAWNRFGQAGLLAQLPRVMKVIAAERQWLQRLSRERPIDGIISDNRYGLYHTAVPSVIITHQLRVRTGVGDLPDTMVQALHYKMLRHFQTLWVADTAGPINLGGVLSHPPVVPAGAAYIGLLSQFEEAEMVLQQGDGLLVLLSGPEPQRGILSRLLWRQVLEYEGQVTFVAGSERARRPDAVPAHIQYHRRLTGKELAPLLQQAAMVICRSGYTTVMDLTALRKNAILIPTPGQTEQEYLGRYLLRQRLFYSVKQGGFNLGKALLEANDFSWQNTGLDTSFSAYRAVLEKWLLQL